MSNRLKNAKDFFLSAAKMLKSCEVVQGVNPYDVNPYEYYEIMDKLSSSNIGNKILKCRQSIQNIDKTVEVIRRDYAGVEPRKAWVGAKYDEVARKIDKSCENLLEGDNINKIQEEYEKLFTYRVNEYLKDWAKNDVHFDRKEVEKDWGENYFPYVEKDGKVNRWRSFERITEGLGKDIEKRILMPELAEACKLLLDSKEERIRTCPIANSNALVQHYTLNERKGDVDIESGIRVRKIERLCVGFPMIKDIPYNDPKTDKHLLTIRVQVNEKADSHGRVGSVAILRPLEKELDYSPDLLWNNLSSYNMEAFYDKVLDWRFGTEYRHARAFDRLDDDVQIIVWENKELLQELLRKQMKGNVEVGKETCVWAARSMSMGQQEKEAEVIEDKIEALKNLNKKIEVYEDYIQSFEQLEHGVVDAHPRQSLFDQTVSTMEAWVEMDLKAVDEDGTPIIDPMLSNMLYLHIAQIDPKLITNQFLKLLEGQKKKGYDNWSWTIPWLDKFSVIRRSFTVDNLRFIHKIIEQPLTKIFTSTHISDILEREGIEYEAQRKYIVEFIEYDTFIERIEKATEKDERLKERIERYIVVRDMPIKKYYKTIPRMDYVPLSSSIINVLLNHQHLLNLIEAEVEAEDTEWYSQTTKQKWSDYFSRARENEEITPDKKDVGLFENVDTNISSFGIDWVVRDHEGNDWEAEHIGDPHDWFQDIDYTHEKWYEHDLEERIDWMVKHTNYTQGEFEDMTQEAIVARLVSEVPYEFVQYHTQCWDYENSCWDEDCILEYGLELDGGMWKKF